MATHKIISYIKAGFLLHITCLIEIGITVCLFYVIDMRSWLANGHVFLKILTLTPIVTLPLAAELDARSRYQNYKLIKDHLFTYGFQPRIMRPFIKSRCQRDAVKAAASELDMLRQCKEYFKKNGYHWYHLLPDIVCKNPSVLFEKNFWMTTLFEKTYRSKINFETNKFLIPTS